MVTEACSEISPTDWGVIVLCTLGGALSLFTAGANRNNRPMTGLGAELSQPCGYEHYSHPIYVQLLFGVLGCVWVFGVILIRGSA